MNAIGYVRLSRDEDRENYSSIESQQLVIYQYAVKHGINIKKIFIDDNVSGYTFDRSGLNQVRKELENPDVTTLIAKDLSRIGRHNAQTLMFIDEIKNAGKKLILPDECSGGFDTSKDDDDIIGIKTWYNERYIKDISRKIRSAIKSRQENGTMLIRPNFGYYIDQKLKKLIIDEETGFIVKEIFEMYIKGNGYRKIAKYLNEMKYQTPSMAIAEKINKNGDVYRNKVTYLWSDEHIRRILKNDVYIGRLRLGKTKKLGIKTKSIKTSLDEQKVFENDHDPLISKDDFELVQKIMVDRDTVKFRGTGFIATKNLNLFSGLLFCGDCREYMVAFNIKDKKKSYVCSKYHRLGKEKCTRHRITEEELLNNIRNFLIFIRLNLENYIKSLDKEVKCKINKEQDEESIDAVLKKKLRILNNEYKTVLSQKIRDLSSNKEFTESIEANYKELETYKLQQIKALSEQINALECLQKDKTSFNSKIQSAEDIFDKIINIEIISRKNLELAIKRIYTYDNHVEIHLNIDIDQLCENY